MRSASPVEMSSFVGSPCISVCQLDPASGWCLGCGRTGDEIAAWPTMLDTDRVALLELLPARMSGLRNCGTMRKTNAT